MNYYHCFSKSVANILNINELDILNNRKLLNLKIDYESNSLCGELYDITEEFLKDKCKYKIIFNEEIFYHLDLVNDGNYCLLTNSHNLTYCKAFRNYPNNLHFITLNKLNGKFYALDYFEGEKYFEEVNLTRFEFNNSKLYLIKKLKDDQNRINCFDILNYYIKQRKNVNTISVYKNKLKNMSITLDTVIDFFIKGSISSRIAYLDMLLSENKISKNNYIIYIGKLKIIFKKIKLLLLKLHFRKNNSDLDKLMVNLNELENLEYRVYKSLRQIDQNFFERG
ncbi:hypothetical protein ACWOBX_05630 [Facklamia languida]